MGGTSSTLIYSVYPVYYVPGTTDSVNEEDIEAAKTAWTLICDNSSASWKRKLAAQQEGQQAEGDESMSHLTFFFETFYARLFDVHPGSRVLFKNSIRAQGKALVGMISAAVSLLRNPEKLVPALEGLAVGHAKKGVLANQYGIVGEVLLYTFARVCSRQIKF